MIEDLRKRGRVGLGACVESGAFERGLSERRRRYSRSKILDRRLDTELTKPSRR